MGARGWNTWNTRSILSHVCLPEGVAVNLGIFEFTEAKFLREALIGRPAVSGQPSLANDLVDAEVIRPYPRSVDGRYTNLELSWRGITLTVESTGDGDDLLVLVTPQHNHPHPPLLPTAARDRAIVRWMAQAIACDIHPLNNLRVLNYLKGAFGQDQDGVNRWYRHWITEGFTGLEVLARRHSGDGAHLFGSSVSIADVCLVPQLYNARRFDTDLGPFPTLVAIGAALATRADFASAVPEAQPDAE